MSKKEILKKLDEIKLASLLAVYCDAHVKPVFLRNSDVFVGVSLVNDPGIYFLDQNGRHLPYNEYHFGIFKDNLISYLSNKLSKKDIIEIMSY